MVRYTVCIFSAIVLFPSFTHLCWDSSARLDTQHGIHVEPACKVTAMCLEKLSNSPI